MQQWIGNASELRANGISDSKGDLGFTDSALLSNLACGCREFEAGLVANVHTETRRQPWEHVIFVVNLLNCGVYVDIR